MKSKKIWLFNDRPLYADDNAKHLFIYSIEQEDAIKRNSKEYKIKKYYVMDENSKDFEDMKSKSKNILKLGSFKHKFLYMFCEKIITSHLMESYFNPFENENIRFYSGIINSDRYFLQHGVTIGDISKYINKSNRYINLFSTLSDLERNFIIGSYCNYDESIVQTLGFPRYDTLENKNVKNQLFIINMLMNTIMIKVILILKQWVLEI